MTLAPHIASDAIENQIKESKNYSPIPAYDFTGAAFDSSHTKCWIQ